MPMGSDIAEMTQEPTKRRVNIQSSWLKMDKRKEKV
jgi:hypothetical protein